MTADFTIDTFRILLHVLGVTVWLGGQIVMLSLLPVLRKSGVEGLPAQAARAFRRVAWPAYGLAFATGVWNLLEVELDNASSGWNVAFGIKFLLVVMSGAAAFVHAQTANMALKGITGGLAFASALGAFILGYAIT